MLRFIKIEMENFGPYKGNKSIDFTEKDGVTIVWGNNGLGKTTLLNVFRYALFGKIVGRGSELTAKKEIINWDSFNNGIHEFRVSLHFAIDNSRYILRRSFRLSDSNLDPNNEKNYREDVGLWHDGQILSANERNHVLQTVMPEQVSRFFLFDGELLKEYEELLHEENGIAYKIKEAIEEILGVPILSNAAADMQTLKRNYEKDLTRAAQKDASTKSMGDAINRGDLELEVQREGLKKLRAEEAEYSARLQELEVELSKNERIKNFVETIEQKQTTISGNENKIEEKRKKICELTADAWKSELSPTVNSLIDQLDSEQKHLSEKKNGNEAAAQILEQLKKSYESKTCVVCKRELDEISMHKLHETLNSFQSTYVPLTLDEQNRYEEITSDIKHLKSLRSANIKEAIEVYENDILDLTCDIAGARQTITEYRRKIDDYSKQKNDIEELKSEIDKKKNLLAITRQSIDETESKINELAGNIEKARNKLARDGGASNEFAEYQRKSLFCSDFHALLDSGLDAYRLYLKQQVEEDASRIFLKLASDPSYIGLKINENYGLNIIHESGQTITIRSSGYEHIVALSLIGALHKNAPLQGPVVMDSPFGRLDSVHEKNIIKFLPDMANQIMLFVFDTEINAQSARTLLQSDLLQELELVRGSTFETVIRSK